MPGLDFSRLTGSSAADTKTHPRDIFAALPARSSRYEYLRDVQREVFDGWFERRSERDLVIKMNTGNGKTLVGLMLLKSALNEHAGPAVYLTPDLKYLVDQVEAVAKDLGLKTSRNPRDPAVLSGSSILLATVSTLFNGRSKFGLAADGRQIKLGTVLIDDAHACLSSMEERFEIRLPASHPAYGQLFAQFFESLKEQGPASLRQLEDNESSSVMAVPYWDWYDQQDTVLEILHPRRGDDELQWGWPLISGVLPICRCVFTPNEAQIKPPYPPVSQIPSFVEAKRRLYLTATLADDSVLVTHFGADPSCVAKSITPSAADDIGDRMILIPQEVRPDWTDEDVKDHVADLSRDYNVVVIVPSGRRAEFWEDVSDDTLDAQTLRDGVERLKDREHGLTILIGKYDGVDLPDGACRVLVIDGLPEAYSGVNRVEAAALRDTAAMTGRQFQRIEQGMGRGIRSRDDYCVVMIMGARLISRLHDPDATGHFSAATVKQLELSREIARLLAEEDVPDLRAVVDQCLNRDPDWVQASRDNLVGVAYGPGHVASAAQYVRHAANLAGQGRYTEAADAQQMAVNAVADRHERGWHMQQLAAYLHPTDEVHAQKQQSSALDHNPALLRPQQGVAYMRLKERAGEQAGAAADYLRGLYSSGDDLNIAVRAILEDLDFHPGRPADPLEQAVADLGAHLGFAAHRPEREFKRGPDDLWGFGKQWYAVIECKGGVTTDFISKHDLGQLSQSMNWFEREYPDPAQALPVMIHRTNKTHESGASPAGCRVITAETLPALRESVKKWAFALARDDQYRNPDRVREQLMARDLHGRQVIERYSRLASDQR